MHDSTKPTFDSELGGAGVPIPYTRTTYSVTVEPETETRTDRTQTLSAFGFRFGRVYAGPIIGSDAPLKYKYT